MGGIKDLQSIDLDIDSGKFLLKIVGTNDSDVIEINNGVILKTIDVTDPTDENRILHVDLEYETRRDVSHYISNADIRTGNFFMYHDLGNVNSSELMFLKNIAKMEWELQFVGGSDIRDARTTFNQDLRVGMGKKNGIYLKLDKDNEIIIIKKW